MKLHEQIYKFRCAKKMSQIEFAEALGVSRQSVSKWETGAAVPEISKLILMSELFGVSLDELVKGSDGTPHEDNDEEPREEEPPQEETHQETTKETPPSSPPLPPPTQIIYQRREGRVIAGYFFIFFAGLTVLLLTILNAFAAGLVIAIPLFLCALICFTCRRRAGLWCAWLIYWVVIFYLLYATGVSPHSWVGYAIFDVLKYGEMTTQFIMSAVMFAIEIAMVAATIFSFRKVNFELSYKSLGLLGGGCIGYIAFHIFKVLFHASLNEKMVGAVSGAVFMRYNNIIRITAPIFSMITTVGATVLLIYILAFFREWRAREKTQ